MSRTTIRGAAAVSLFFTAACTQPPAIVDLKGQNTYGPGGEHMVAAAQPRRPVFSFSSSAPAAPVESRDVAAPITVSDVSAPQETLPSPSLLQPKQQAKAEGIKNEQQANAGGIQKVNPWTGKERTEFIEAKAEPKKEEKKTARLDNIWNGKGVTVDRAKPVKLSSDSLMLIWPVNGNKVISGFGPKGAGKANDGINIAAGEGEPVWASADGEIVYVGNEISGYGNMILVRHANNKTTTYAHLSSATVDKYDRVKQGDIIGYVGSTGNVKDSQLHFAVRDGKEAVDPLKYVSRSVAGL